MTDGGVTFRRHWWYVWLGVIEWGNLEKFYLYPVGLVKSDGEKGAIPPLSESLWSKVCEEVFDTDTCAMFCSDTARAYVNYNPLQALLCISSTFTFLSTSTRRAWR